MRNLFRTLAIVLGGAIGVVALALPAAATFTSPTPPGPFTLSVNGSGDPLPFDIVVNGFHAGDHVVAEICDGTPASAQGWDPTINCDQQTAGSYALADANGVATFLASDVNRHINPFRGEGPSQLFNCIHAGDADPGNGEPTFSNCQLKVSTSLANGTTDQQFMTLTLPSAGGGPVTPEVPFAVLLPIGAIAVGGGYFLIRRRRASRGATA